MKRIFYALVAVAALSASALPAKAAALTGVCSPTTVRYIASDKNDSTNSTSTYANLPEGAIAFTLSKAGCVIVTFSSEFNSGGWPVGMRAYLDNTTAGLPNDMQFSQNLNEINARTFTYIFRSVPAGSHVIRMQFASGVNGQTVTVRKHNMLIHYTP